MAKGAARRTLGKLCLLVFLVLFSLFGVCLFRALVYFPRPKPAEPCEPSPNHKPIKQEPKLIERFKEALRHKTITSAPYKYDAAELLRFHQWITKTYPSIHSSPFVKREIVANYSLIYTIKGSDASLKPYMLCAHLDVVPVELDKWTVPPFDGLERDGMIYGRGTIDVKDSLIGLLEAMEHLLSTGFKPRRTIIMAFGHDEEGSGFEGAQAIAQTLEARGHTDLLYLLDEGSIIMKDSFVGVEGLVALVGVSEKGYITFEMKASGQAGHSSLAPKETSILKLTRAVSRFTSDAHPTRFGNGPERDLFEALAPYSSFVYKFFFSNLWLFGPLVSLAVSTVPMGNSLVRTTSAVTVISGGVKDNVIPSEARAFVNHRIHPYDSIASVREFDEQLINDPGIELSIAHGNAFEPHPVSPYGSDSFGYQTIKRTLREIWPDIIVVPGVMVASTDTKWYQKLTKSIYRFTPVVLRSTEAKLFHGHDERISVDNYVKIVNYYHHLILASDEPKLKPESIVKDEL